MKYLNSSFTMPTCTKPMSDRDYDIAVGNISPEEGLSSDTELEGAKLLSEQAVGE